MPETIAKMTGIVFDIQHYAVYDGPGIRTTIFLKGCPLKCIWCHNPESQQLKPQMSYFEEKCLGCGNCVAACPNNALSLIDGKITREQDLCTTCGSCVAACPNKVMEIIGKEMSVEEVVNISTRDIPFYDTSNGGVTISGGEATMQLQFLLELLLSLKENGIHTVLETCGYFNKEFIAKLTENVDLFLYDIKQIDDQVHNNFTGVSNKLILNNFREILSHIGSTRIIPRIPLIPGVNTDLESIKKIISFLEKINYVGEIHIMPYNKLAKTKYEKVGMGELYKDMGELTDENLQIIVDLFENHSYKVLINH